MNRNGTEIKTCRWTTDIGICSTLQTTSTLRHHSSPNSVTKERPTGSQAPSHIARVCARRPGARGGAARGQVDSQGALLSDPGTAHPYPRTAPQTARSHQVMFAHVIHRSTVSIFVSWRFNSHTITLTLLKYTSQCILVYSHSSETVNHYLGLGHFFILRKKLHTHQSLLTSSSVCACLGHH